MRKIMNGEDITSNDARGSAFIAWARTRPRHERWLIGRWCYLKGSVLITLGFILKRLARFCDTLEEKRKSDSD
ncbi:MAG: hypothetical protein EOP06_17025 [Proteobacteria bacterium]|nr:MAG: hypothetical protein EOP06_17025 [Pseudomonadota bacterium]